MTYQLRFPIKVQGDVLNVEAVSAFRFGPISMSIRKEVDLCILQFSGFQTETEAARFIPRAWLAVRWLLIADGVNVRCSVDLGNIVWAPDPALAAINLSRSFDLPHREGDLIHGLGSDATSPLVYEDGKSIRNLHFGTPTISTGYQAQRLVNQLSVAFHWPATVDLHNDARFRLAADLYSNLRYEFTAHAKIVQLGTVLEVLAGTNQRHPAALELLEKWKSEITRAESEADDGAVRSGLRALRGDMIFAQQTSIASSIQQLCLDLVGYGNVDADSTVRAKALYRSRSTVVHSGSLSPDVLSSGLDDGMQLVQSLLQAYVLRAVALGSAEPI